VREMELFCTDKGWQVQALSLYGPAAAALMAKHVLAVVGHHRASTKIHHTVRTTQQARILVEVASENR
jgi:hypothetical protein